MHIKAGVLPTTSCRAGALQWAEAASLPHAGDANINEDTAEPVHHGSSQRPPTQLDAGIPKSSKLSSQQKMQPEVLQRAHLQLTNRATELCEQLTPVTIRNVSGVSQVLPKCCQSAAKYVQPIWPHPMNCHTSSIRNKGCCQIGRTAKVPPKCCQTRSTTKVRSSPHN